jgi:hypothetical protein
VVQSFSVKIESKVLPTRSGLLLIVLLRMSAGVRWGTSVPAGYDVTMEDLMTNTSMTYGETYVTELKGSQLKGQHFVVIAYHFMIFNI